MNNLHEIYEDDKNNLYDIEDDNLLMQAFLYNDYDIPEQPQDNIEKLIDEDNLEEKSVNFHENQVNMHKE